jgi:hypothetical protein
MTIIGTAVFKESQDPTNLIRLSIIYKVRFSEKVAIQIVANPEAARV